MKKIVKEVIMRDEGDLRLVTLVFMDGSTVDLKGPRGGFTYTERDEGNGIVVYDCEFNGFTLA